MSTLSEEEVTKAAQKMFGFKHSHDAMHHMKKKYDDTTLTKILAEYSTRQQKLIRRVNKFSIKLHAKYGHYDLSLSEVMKLAFKVKAKYEFTDDEFDTFLKTLFKNKNKHYTTAFTSPNSNMSYTLGYDNTAITGNRLVVPDEDAKEVQTILNMYDSTKLLHSNVIIQSETAFFKFKDMHSIKNQIAEPYSNVHPVLFALFAKKIPQFEETFMLSSISKIVKSKWYNEPIDTLPDFKLYSNMVTDPNDMVCDSKKPIVDLKYRANLQARLWESVLNMRNGEYSSNANLLFIDAIEKCRPNIYDSVDLAYIRDDGTIARKLLSAFSLRPTVITTIAMYAPHTTYQYPHEVNQLTKIPMITIRLPSKNMQHLRTVLTTPPFAQPSSPASGQPPGPAPGQPTSPIYANQALVISNWFLENKIIVPKTQHVVYSDSTLMFYINRRDNSMQYSNMLTNTLFNYSALPVGVSSLDRLNDTELFFNDIKVHDNTFVISSGVYATFKPIGDTNMIIGSGAFATFEYCVYGTDTYSKCNPPDAFIKYNQSENNPMHYIRGDILTSEELRKQSTFVVMKRNDLKNFTACIYTNVKQGMYTASAETDVDTESKIP